MSPAVQRLLVPTLLTLGNAACGFGAIVVLSRLSEPWLTVPPDMRLAIAAWLVFAGWLFDMVDGSVAKLMNATSDFGGQLDSLCDAVTFGVLPGLLIVEAGGRHPFAFLAGLCFVAAALVRLARFNQANAHAPDDHLYFQGLSSPAAAMTISAAALSVSWAGAVAQQSPWTPLALCALALLLAGLMVSRIRYADLPKHYARKLAPRWTLLPAIAALVVLPLPLAMLLLTTLYVVGGLAGALGGRSASAGEATP